MAKKKQEQVSTSDEMLPSEFYANGESDRNPYENRAKELSALTVPYLIRDDTATGTNPLADEVAQSYGARLVNTLKAKMGMALLPPSASSFRLAPDSTELAALTQGSPDNRAKVYAELSGAITAVNNELEIQQVRSSLFDAIAQLLVVGSVIVEKKKEKGILIHNLQSFIVDLDNQGNPIKMCIVEKLKVLPEGIVPKEVKDEYEVYTMATMDKDTGGWVVVQEIEQELVGTETKYKSYEVLPFRYLGWTWMKGDSYHRPYSEDYQKDLEQLNKHAQLLTDGSVISAKSLIFVNQRGGRTRKEDVANSANGDVVDGSAEDVTTFKNEKNFDFQVPAEREAQLKKELASAYLMNESVTRDAERVTAEEIQFMARELESSSLSGIYSKLSLQWSKWVIQQIMIELQIEFKSVTIEVITGLDALGRSQEAQKLDRLLQRAEALGLRHWYKDDEILNRYASFEGVNTVGLMKTPAEVAQEQQAAQAAQSDQLAIDAASQSAGATAGANAAEKLIPQSQ